MDIRDYFESKMSMSRIYSLTVVDKCPSFTDFDVALQRTMIGAFPAAMSAKVTDNPGS